MIFKKEKFPLKRKMSKEETKIITFKVLILGESGVGKTCLFQRFTSGVFSNTYKATVGVDFAVKRIKWADNIEVNLNFWDMAGQERFYEACKGHFRQTDGIFCVMDMSNPQSSKKCHDWKDRAINLSTDYSGNQNRPPVICLGNKYDLFKPEDFDFSFSEIPLDENAQGQEEIDIYGDEKKEDQTSIEKEKFSLWSKKSGYVDGYLVSAKDNLNLDDCMKDLISRMIDRYLADEKEQEQEKDTEIFKLGSENDKKMQEKSYIGYYYNSLVGNC